jgi:hypothetical protein
LSRRGRHDLFLRRFGAREFSREATFAHHDDPIAHRQHFGQV